MIKSMTATPIHQKRYV